MPIFEYFCESCKENFEKIVTQSTEVICPECGGKELTKKLSHFSFSQKSPGQPACQSGCGEGFQKGGCGSGLCPGGH